jgi:hypothetical protein
MGVYRIRTTQAHIKAEKAKVLNINPRSHNDLITVYGDAERFLNCRNLRTDMDNPGRRRVKRVTAAEDFETVAQTVAVRVITIEIYPDSQLV